MKRFEQWKKPYMNGMIIINSPVPPLDGGRQRQPRVEKDLPLHFNQLFSHLFSINSHQLTEEVFKRCCLFLVAGEIAGCRHAAHPSRRPVWAGCQLTNDAEDASTDVSIRCMLSQVRFYCGLILV